MTKTIVLPTARAIRHKQLATTDTLFLPNYLSMGEFISKLTLVRDFKPLDDDTRVLLLLEASDFKAFSSLQIERNFFTFTKNSTYIFKFFEELSGEMYNIHNLLDADVYAEYEEHITILQTLYERYKKICFEKKVLDKIFLPELYEFNKSYVKSLEDITLHVDGYLTNFELKLLQECCEYAKVKLVFKTTKFNLKIVSKLNELGFELEDGFLYELDFNNKKVLKSTRCESVTKNVKCESFTQEILQVAFIKQKVYEFVQKGFDPEKIAVILPNEAMAQKLKSFDEKINFNFAMGSSFANTQFFQKLDATCSFIEQKTKENEARFLRVGDEFFQKLVEIYYKSVDEVELFEFLDSLKDFIDGKNELKLYEMELYKFEKIAHFFQGMNVKSVMKMFLQRLASLSIDDVRGGKVTVMGVLETRSVEFDGVVIVDFDDNNVPKKSEKDMFLNTQLRQNAKLPTIADRQNLQKHYYQLLLENSKEVCISYVDSKESSPSRFLKQLGIKTKNSYDELDYAKILFTPSKQTIQRDEDIVVDYSFKDVLISSSRLETYLTCKRKYYYRYIKKLKHHEVPKDMSKEYEVGNMVHLALKNLYTKQDGFFDVLELKSALFKELDNVCKDSEMDKFLISLQKKRLEKFCEYEVSRFRDGWRVLECEKSLKTPFYGLTLTGQIDRVDVNEQKLKVLDYKTGRYELYSPKTYQNATNFQLEFYYLLARELGEDVECAFYDLKDIKIVDESLLKEKLDILTSHIKDLLHVEQIETLRCEDSSACRNCEYKIMCGVE